MMRRIFPAFAAGAAAIFVMASAAEARMGLPPFERLDTDGTGEVTRDAFLAQIQGPPEQMVERIMQHANAEGLLDKEGLRAGLAEAQAQGRGHRREDRVSRLFARIDRNGDGVIDAEEYGAFAERLETRRHGRD